MQPTLVYDDDCGFCTRSARFVARHGSVRIVGFSELSHEQRERLPPEYQECAHLLTDDTVYSCGEAVERAFAETELAPAGLFDALGRVPGYPATRERVYRWVAENRGTVGRLLP
ncbi:thiol-disulfide oxidoreductase DCC family protein [Halorhabdus amylolytica]|uniref:thiol-disulfide oxidoreductase DCC family protein n=1 Tax=Halorhabdus amylolytica TaxID=2559573 RepID=UPI0010AB2417|nr:DUF393 domain-containing protein [Halorhabdus amylolytica]